MIPVAEFRVPSARRNLNVNLKLVGSNCNMRCQYCYEHDTPEWAGEPLDPRHVETFIEALPSDVSVRFVLHGGEPLLYPKDMMQSLLQMIAVRLPDRHQFHIQTNGTLLDADWLGLLSAAAPEMVISISADPPGGGELRRLPGRDFSAVLRQQLQFAIDRGATVGIVSVAHRGNLHSFPSFLSELVAMRVRYLTITKLRRNHHERKLSNVLAPSEQEFVNLLQNIGTQWINQRLFEQIQIQPLMSLLSPSANRICIFDSSPEKCSEFISLYPGGWISGCDHLAGAAPKFLPACSTCSIYNWCGGGCLGEERDPTFCEARFQLKTFVEGVSI
jgi:uncharacterized protein